MFNLFHQSSPLKESLSVILLITMLFSAGVWVLLYPKPVQAQADTIGGPFQVKDTIWGRVEFGFKQVWNTVASADRAITAAVASWQKADTILGRAAAAAAEIALHTVLRMLTNEIITWIQGGGEPRFVSDWQGFLREAGDKVGGLFVDKYLGAGWLCESFDLDIKMALLDVPTFDTRVQCTISDIVENIDDFYNDFSAGGWKGWIELTKPQNNFYGAYFIALEEKLELEQAAREAAGQEAIAGRGFLSVKNCVAGYLDDEGSKGATCNDKNSCNELKDFGFFVCEKETVTTPSSVISDITSRALDRDLELIQDQIAALTPAKGILAPYITAIGSALVNKLITEGLSLITGDGPSIDNPSAPMPAGTSVAPINQTPGQVIQTQNSAISLSGQQALLKENLEIDLLPQQQSNLSTMQSIESIQTNILTTLKDILAQGCSLPSWANSQTYSATIQITASGVGSALIDKITYQIQSITPQISSQIPDMEQKIAETNQWIADSASAIISTNGYNQAVDDYLALYQQTLQPPTAQEQAALDQKEQSVIAAENLAIIDGQILTGSSASNLDQLNIDTQNINTVVIQESLNLLQARGMSETYPQSGTLYDQKNLLQTKLSQAQSSLSSCP